MKKYSQDTLENKFVGTNNGVLPVKRAKWSKFAVMTLGVAKGSTFYRWRPTVPRGMKRSFAGYFGELMSDTAYEGTVRSVQRDRPDLVLAKIES